MTTASLNTVELAEAVPSALVLRVARQLVGARRNVFVDVPGRAGSWAFAEQPGDRTLTLLVDITEDGFDTRRAAIRDLALWADVGGVARLIVDDEPDRYHDAILDDSVDVNEWLTYATEIPVLFRVGPYASALEISEEILAVGPTSPDSGIFTAPDNVDALPVIEITPTNGTLTSFDFTLNGAGIGYDGTVADDDTITISSLVDTVFAGDNIDPDLDGLLNPALVAMDDVSADSTFPRIVHGDNEWELIWTGTATAVTIAIRWRERFR